jgi:ADP-heptose:LPS heptosyltransferase
MNILIGLLEHMGDIVACEPVSRYLKTNHPEAQLTWAVLPAYRELIDTNPHIDNTLTLECLTEWIKLTRHSVYDLVVDLHVNYRVCQHCGIPLIKECGNPFVNVYEWFDYGSLLEAFSVGAGLPRLSAQPNLYLKEEHKKAIDHLNLPEEYCVIHCRSNDINKDWRNESWHQICRRIKDTLELEIVEVGSSDEDYVSPDGVISLINRLPILQSAEVIRRARFFIGIDSGPAHLANALMIPSVVLLGRLGVFRQYMPYSGFFASNSLQVKLVRNPTGSATELTVEEVMEAVMYLTCTIMGCAMAPTGSEPSETTDPPSPVRPVYSPSHQEDRDDIATSGLFDRGWYVVHHPEVAGSGMDPVDHYLAVGGFAGYSPGPSFDALQYIQMYEDIRREQVNPLLHYIRSGKTEGRLRYEVFQQPYGSPLPDSSKRQSKVTPSVMSAAFPPVRKVANAAVSTRPLSDHHYPRTFAFYLPQFHPIRENDWAHGDGFTEWNNVIKAQPLYKGHYQPRVPGELGFYDLRSCEVLYRQIALAQEYHITGFCVYYYYFHGRRLLYKPISNLLNSDLNFPFFLLWANENWTKRWDGGDHDIIMSQNHSREDDLYFIRQVLPIFEDDRYVKIEGKPILLIYKAHLFPDITATIEIWRGEAEKWGFAGLYLVAVDDWSADPEHPRQRDFDASYEIPSNLIPEQVLHTDPGQLELREGFAGQIVDYRKFASFHMGRSFPSHKRFRTVMLPWDNTARYGQRAIVHVNGDGDDYKIWLIQALLDTYRRYAPDERIVFLHSWNEWCEGTYLEPDGKFGRKYLAQTSEAVRIVNEAIDLARDDPRSTAAISALLRMMQAKDEGAFRTAHATRMQLESIRSENAELKAAIQHYEHECARLQGMYEFAAAQRDSLYASTSWRITGPLRAIVDFLLHR